MALIPHLQHNAGHFEELPGLIVEGLRFLSFIINSQLELVSIFRCHRTPQIVTGAHVI